MPFAAKSLLCGGTTNLPRRTLPAEIASGALTQGMLSEPASITRATMSPMRARATDAPRSMARIATSIAFGSRPAI